MSDNVQHRYGPTYREAEVRLVCQSALRGESLAFVGVAGVGKSNLVNSLREASPLKMQYLGERAGSVHFPVVDATSWQGTPESLWTLMLRSLNVISRGITLQEEFPIIPLSEEERTLQRLQAWVRELCQRRGRQLMFVLDDFDKVFASGPLQMLEEFNIMRSDGNRGSLSYLVFTKRLPHVLGRSYRLETESKFFDLFRHNIYALEPYTAPDATQMLIHLNAAAKASLRGPHLTSIYRLAGGHAQLLRTIFNLWLQEGPLSVDAAAQLARHPDVQQECRRILDGLHEDEKYVALQAALGQHTADDEPIIDHLARRGLVLSREPLAWFSPVFGKYLEIYARDESI